MYTYNGIWENVARIVIGRAIYHDVHMRKFVTWYSGFVSKILYRKLKLGENPEPNTLADFEKSMLFTLTFLDIVLIPTVAVLGIIYGQYILPAFSFVVYFLLSMLNRWNLYAFIEAQKQIYERLSSKSSEGLTPLEMEDEFQNKIIREKLAELDIALANGRGIVKFATMTVEIIDDNLGILYLPAKEFKVYKWTTPNNAKEIVKNVLYFYKVKRT